MNDQDLSEDADGVPSLVSLALFAIAFLAAILAVEFGTGLLEPVRVALAALPASVKAGALAALILGVMAVVRVAVLLGGGSRKGTN